MTSEGRDPERRARRLLRRYPHAWRERYGEEFEQLLIDDIEECPRSPSRTLDVLRSGSLARVGEAGLASDVLDPVRQLRAGVAAIGCALCLFLIVGVGIWSQRAGASGAKTGRLPLVEQPCPSCASVLDGLDGAALHLWGALDLAPDGRGDAAAYRALQYA